MSDHVCKICGNDINPYYGSVTLTDHASPQSWIHEDICSNCLTEIVLQALKYKPDASVMPAVRVAIDGLCWLCGDESKSMVYIEIGCSGRMARICEKCRRDLLEQGRRFAGLPTDWPDRPRLCSTCDHLRGDVCRASPPVPSFDGRDYHSLQPDIDPSKDEAGCDSDWRPRVRRGTGTSFRTVSTLHWQIVPPLPVAAGEVFTVDLDDRGGGTATSERGMISQLVAVAEEDE